MKTLTSLLDTVILAAVSFIYVMVGVPLAILSKFVHGLYGQF